MNKTIKHTPIATALAAVLAARGESMYHFRSSLPADVERDKEGQPIRKAKRADAMASVVANGEKAAKGKEANYTAEVTAELVEAYKNGETVEALAERFAKSARSIVAKLSREQVYKPKEYLTKQGEKPISKEELVSIIEKLMALDSGKLESLEKANKTVLKLIQDHVTKIAQDFDNATADDQETVKGKAAALAKIIERLGLTDEEDVKAIQSLKLAKHESLELLANRI